MATKEKEKEKDTTLELFGVESASVEKSLDIKPIYNLGKSFPYNQALEIEFLEDAPKIVETPNSKFKESSRVISILDLTTNLEYSLFLSSKTLSLGVAKLYKLNNNSLKGIRARIIKTTAKFKDFGENDCYVVQQIKV